MLELVGRVRKIAEGAALMTETTMEMRIVSAVSDVVGNTPLEETLHNVLEELGPPHFDEADRDFARQIQATLAPGDIDAMYRTIGMKKTDAPLADFLVPRDAKRNPAIGSTDVGDVSWVVPTVQAHAPTVAIGTPFHTWQVVTQGKTPAAHKAMVQVAKAMAATGAAALMDPGLIAAAKAAAARGTAAAHHVGDVSGRCGAQPERSGAAPIRRIPAASRCTGTGSSASSPSPHEAPETMSNMAPCIVQISRVPSADTIPGPR
jgi:aminobenzoyl-glutamate utilization protein B